MSIKSLSIITIIVFFIIAGLLGALFFISKQPPEDVPREDEVELNPVPEKTPEKKPEKEEDAEELKEFDESLFNAKDAVLPSEESADRGGALVFARVFIEDYGSFSSASGYRHIENYYPKMTQSMLEFTEIWIKVNPTKVKSDSFYSIETSVANLRIDEYGNNSATVFIETARVETDVPEYYNRQSKQDVEVKLVKDEEEWKVDGVYWK
ncbi:MAG: hypothetical protein A3E05_02185 [Candidatus Jacksonbacteria bacterium RIFCSPHIGHO2_12_FULL_44_12]|nr:MAG: hypothetical protein A3E05_02185 [Candidatus Jacksonbacteria bacterium RIFCSPHIGHO2_12_FULL_44_12]